MMAFSIRSAVLALLTAAASAVHAQAPDEAHCEALESLANLTIDSAALAPATAEAPMHCYVRGTLSGTIRFHMQLPLPGDWNGRLLNMGDGGKDGDLDYSDHRVAQGYAVANSNTGHDAGAERGASFARDDEQAVIDFGWRAIHLTANASKTLVRAYYGRPSAYDYFEGCSTGGRQGLMEAQRFPDDFDGIVSGAPVYDYQVTNITNLWMARLSFLDDFAGNLAYDSDGNGRPDDLSKWRIVRDEVLAVCDAIDGIEDGLITNPAACTFDPDQHLAGHMCPNDVDAAACLTERQLDTVRKLYGGPRDSRGTQVGGGMDFGSEYDWHRSIVAHEGNNLLPSRLLYVLDHMNYLFYEESPGAPVTNPTDLSIEPSRTSSPPEFAWWEFDVDDYTAGKSAAKSAILDATDPDLSRFMHRHGGKLLLYHGWADPERPGQPVIDYYRNAVDATFDGDAQRASQQLRLFMVPGMGHCDGGPGLSEWDRLAPLVDWVENGNAPDEIVAEHHTNGEVDNQRVICPYPQNAVYVGPRRSANDPDAWVAENFQCR